MEATVENRELVCQSKIKLIQLVLEDGTTVAVSEGFFIASIRPGDSVKLEKNGDGYHASCGQGESLNTHFHVDRDGVVMVPKPK